MNGLFRPRGPRSGPDQRRVLAGVLVRDGGLNAWAAAAVWLAAAGGWPVAGLPKRSAAAEARRLTGALRGNP